MELGKSGVAGFQQGEERGEAEEGADTTVDSCKEVEGETRESQEGKDVENSEVAAVETEWTEETLSTETGGELAAGSVVGSLNMAEEESGLVPGEISVQVGGEGEGEGERGECGEDGEGGGVEQVGDNSALPLATAEDMPAEAMVEEPPQASQPESDGRPSPSILGK